MFNVGEKVYVKPSTEWFDKDVGTFNWDMRRYIGCYANITGKDKDGYRLDIDGGKYLWAEKWLTKEKPYRKNDISKIWRKARDEINKGIRSGDKEIERLVYLVSAEIEKQHGRI